MVVHILSQIFNGLGLIAFSTSCKFITNLFPVKMRIIYGINAYLCVFLIKKASKTR